MDAVVPLWMRAVPLGVALLYGPFLSLWLRGFGRVAMRGYRAAYGENPNLHWTERARLSFAPRTFASSALYIFPCQAAFFASHSVGSVSIASEAWVVSLTALGAFSSAYLALRRLGLELGFKRSALWYDLRATLFSLHGVLLFGLATFGFWKLGDAVAKHRFEPLLVAIPAIALLSGHVQTLVFRAIGLYREDQALLGSLEPVFLATGLRPRALWVVPSSLANAFAYPLRKTIAVTERLLEVLTPDELAAVVAHEVGHLKEGHKAWWRLGVLWFFCGASFAFAFVDPEDVFAFFWTAFAIVFALLVGLRAWSRRREQDADKIAVAASDPAVYARALEKLYEVNLIPAALRSSSHPSLYDRLERAGITPDYARPALPSRKPTWAGLIAIALFPAVSASWPHLWREASGDSAAVAAVVTKQAHPLGRLALAAWGEGDNATAIALYRRAEELDVQSPWYPRNIAAVLNQTGDCQGAREAAERARVKAANDPEVVSSLFAIECAE